MKQQVAGEKPMAEAPRIRTKADRWKHPSVGAVEDRLEALRRGGSDVQVFQDETLRLLAQARLATALAAEIEDVRGTAADMWLLRRHVEDCRYTLQLVHVAEGEVHPPHHHHNLISTQVVLEGRLHLREYERIRREGPDRVRLRLVTDRMLGPGDAFQASEWVRNVHWFAAVDGRAIVFNLNARGYERETFAAGGDFGRLYLDPARIESDATILAEEIPKDEALARFSGRRLDAFPAPPADNGTVLRIPVD